MAQISIKIHLDGPDPDRIGLYAQDLQEFIRDRVPDGVTLSLIRDNPQSQQFFETIVVDVVAAGIVHLVFEAIKYYSRSPGLVLRIEKDGKVVVIDDVHPGAADELQKLS